MNFGTKTKMESMNFEIETKLELNFGTKTKMESMNVEIETKLETEIDTHLGCELEIDTQRHDTFNGIRSTEAIFNFDPKVNYENESVMTRGHTSTMELNDSAMNIGHDSAVNLNERAMIQHDRAMNLNDSAMNTKDSTMYIQNRGCWQYK